MYKSLKLILWALIFKKKLMIRLSPRVTQWYTSYIYISFLSVFSIIENKTKRKLEVLLWY